MTQKVFEERLTALERKVADLELALANDGRKKDWRRTIGMFSDDPVMKEVFEEALKYRERDREQARRRFARSEKAKRAASAKKA